VIIHIFALANDEPNPLWRTLLDSGFLGGNSLVSALRADPISLPETIFPKLRYLLDKVRNYFEQNPEEEI
jgi:fluoride ion exporter CrcB/FEX